MSACLSIASRTMLQRHALRLPKRGQTSGCSYSGSLGDGNIHLAISAGPVSGADRVAVEHIVYRPLGKLGGSVSAEHGIGLEKKNYLAWCRSEAEISVMKALKKTLDPKGILNPGKIFD